MILDDWRQVPPHALAPIYAAERERSLRMLRWEAAPIWDEVELARTTWGLPGLVAHDRDGRLRGMLFYVVDGDRLDVGGIASDDVQATDALLDGLLAAAAGIPDCVVRMLLIEGAVALASGLRSRGFTVETHLYLSRALSDTPAPGPVVRGRQPVSPGREWDGDGRPAFGAWRASDLQAAAALLRRAYPASAGALFAAHHRPAEWERYVTNLVTHPGCGTLNADATAVLRVGDRIDALAMITDIGPRTAHIVQLAVDPSHRRRGLGRALVDDVCRRLTARQYQAVTLLVAGSNAAARALYDGAGFRQDASFIGATLSLAESGGTRRSTPPLVGADAR